MSVLYSSENKRQDILFKKGNMASKVVLEFLAIFKEG